MSIGKRSKNLIIPFSDFLDIIHSNRNKQAWSIKNLLDTTAPSMKQRGVDHNCGARVVSEPAIDSDLRTDDTIWVYHTWCKGPKSSDQGYETKIQLKIDTKKRKLKSWNDIDVKVQCTCPAFEYWGPERNAWLNNYDIEPHKGEPQIIPKRNLKLKDGTPWTRLWLCKHLTIAAKDIITRDLPKRPGFLGKVWSWIKKRFKKSSIHANIEKYSNIPVKMIFKNML